MTRVDSASLAEALLAAPHTTLLALTLRDGRLRQKAATQLARSILGLADQDHPDQLSLPMNG